MDDVPELQKLADDPELIVSVEVGNGVFEASIGDPKRGYRAWSRTQTFAAAVRWLREQAQTLYPESRYVRQLLSGPASAR